MNKMKQEKVGQENDKKKCNMMQLKVVLNRNRKSLQGSERVYSRVQVALLESIDACLYLSVI